MQAKRHKGGMKIRNHPKKGFIVDGLVVTPVTNFAAIDNRINEGKLRKGYTSRPL